MAISENSPHRTTGEDPGSPAASIVSFGRDTDGAESRAALLADDPQLDHERPFASERAAAGAALERQLLLTSGPEERLPAVSRAGVQRILVALVLVAATAGGMLLYLSSVQSEWERELNGLSAELATSRRDHGLAVAAHTEAAASLGVARVELEVGARANAELEARVRAKTGEAESLRVELGTATARNAAVSLELEAATGRVTGLERERETLELAVKTLEAERLSGARRLVPAFVWKSLELLRAKAKLEIGAGRSSAAAPAVETAGLTSAGK